MATSPAVVGTSAITPQLRTKEALYILHNKLNFVKKLVNYSDKFKGGGTGRTYWIGKPAQWSTRSGYSVSANATIEDKVALTIGDPIGVDAAFHDDELELDFPNYKQRVLEGQMKKLASAIEKNVLQTLLAGIPFGINSASLAIADFYKAQRIQDEQLADGERFALLSAQAYEDYLVASEGKYNPQIDISTQIREGVLGNIAGYSVMKNLLLPNHTTGSRVATGAATVTTTPTEGDALLALTLSTSTTIKAGDQFTVAGVYDINPENKDVTAQLHRFVALADVTAGTAVSVPVDPMFGAAATVSNGSRQNLSALPANGAAVIFIGAASTSFTQSLFFDGRMGAVAFVDLPLHTGAVIETWKETDPDTGITLRYERGYNIQTGTQYTRWDVQMGSVLVQKNFGLVHSRTA